MFCHKCGNEAAEGAAFCNKCGAKFLTEAAQATASEPVQTVQSTYQQQTAVDTSFREFVDNHVRTTTKFKSAEDLLTNAKPNIYILFCFGIAALVGLFLGPIGILIIGGLFGYTAMFITGGIIRMKYRRKFSGEFTGDINIDDLFIFLNEHLKQVSPNFHEWGRLTKTGFSLYTIAENAMTTALEKAVKEVPLCAAYGQKKKRLVVLTIRQNPDGPTAIRRYFVDATKRGFSLDSRANGMIGHSTLIKTAPILQAAMEYYLKTRG